MFKVGQKVVFTGHGCINPELIYPKKNEIVTIAFYHGCVYGGHYYVIVEYPKGKDGKEQYIDSKALRPLDESFADEVLERVKEEINKEELVLI